MSTAEIALLEGRYPDATRIILPTPWTLLVIGGGWVTGPDPAEIRIDAAGNVQIRGFISGGAAPAIVATVPAGFAPVANSFQNVMDRDTAGPTFATSTLEIDTAGNIILQAISASVDDVFFDGVCWSVFI